MLGIVRTTDAMRGGHTGGDRGDRMLQRISVHDRRRSSGRGSTSIEKIDAFLAVGDFHPNKYMSPELAEMMHAMHQDERRVAEASWAKVGDWTVPLSTTALIRRLELVKAQRRPATAQKRGGYLNTGRPATAAAGRGVAAARALRRSSSGPSRLRTAPLLELRAMVRVVLACNHLGHHVEPAAKVGHSVHRPAQLFMFQGRLLA